MFPHRYGVSSRWFYRFGVSFCPDGFLGLSEVVDTKKQRTQRSSITQLYNVMLVRTSWRNPYLSMPYNIDIDRYIQTTIKYSLYRTKKGEHRSKNATPQHL